MNYLKLLRSVNSMYINEWTGYRSDHIMFYVTVWNSVK